MQTRAFATGVLVMLAVAACHEPSAPGSETTPGTPSFAAAKAPATDPAQRVAALAARTNERLAAKGSRARISGAWFFTVGKGVPEFRTLRTGLKWYKRDISYVLDESGYTPTLPASDITEALVAARESWNAVANANIHTARIATPTANIEALDQIILDGDGNCVDIFDPKWEGPVADIVTGGWLPVDYFEKCLGSADIIAVTWSFTFDGGLDTNGDNYVDLAYVEQYFNPRWSYVTSGSQYLDFEGPFDLQSIAVHEDGHSLGLDHTGGPNPNQPFKLHPNGRVFSPEAVMNPFSLGGEKRDLFSLDQAALRTLYASPR